MGESEPSIAPGTEPLPRLTRPGLLITGTDTGVGKTVIACAIAAALRREPGQRRGWRVGVCKPFATGCRREREGLVSPDAEALAHFADCRLALATINPIRFAPPLAPAAAAEHARQRVDWASLNRSLAEIERTSDAVIVEGVGGLMVPLDPDRPRVTVLDLAAALGVPTVIVARSGLGTLNHTAMTVKLLESRRCRVAGIVMNGYEADEAIANDPSITLNRRWLERLTGTRVLAIVPRVDASGVAPEAGRIDETVLDAVAACDWAEVMGEAGEGTKARRHEGTKGKRRGRK